jgi:hypothetical protein
VEEHEKWWDLIWEAQKKRGDKISTFVPEYGNTIFFFLVKLK